MSRRTVYAALLLLPLVTPTLAAAQSASPAQDTELQLEAKRKRFIVRPEPPVAAAVRDAERAASEAAAARIVQEENPTVRQRPQLDYDVTSAVQARNVHRGRVGR
jgi:hypothetical protein